MKYGSGAPITIRNTPRLIPIPTPSATATRSPQASIAPIIEQGTDTLLQVVQLGDVDEETTEWVAVVRQASRLIAERYNLFTLLRARSFGMPSLLAWGDTGLNMPSVYEVIWVYFLNMIEIPELVISVAKSTFLTAQIWTIQSEGIWNRGRFTDLFR